MMCQVREEFLIFIYSFNTLRCLIKREALISEYGGLNFFIYYMKNSGKGGNFFCLLQEKQGEGVKIYKIK